MKTILEAKHLKKSYGKVKILDDISLEVQQGQFVVIMGSSGAGKTTLLDCISGMDSPDDGHVKLLGNVLNKINNQQLAEIRSQKMGFVFQDFRLLDDMSLIDNLLIRGYLCQNKKDALIQAQMLLDKVNLSTRKDNYPNQLSGGQKQRGAIARALMNNPEVIFADEPTGALNSSSSTQVLDTLSDVNENMQTTILMVTHDTKAAIYGTKVIYLLDGKILGDLKFKKDSTKESREKELTNFLNRMGW